MLINEIIPNPNNPRICRDAKFKLLVKSIREFPEMLNLRPIVIDENNIILGGNQRYRACIEAGLTDVPVIHANNLTEEQKKQFIVRDNVSTGDWDFDLLANEWSIQDYCTKFPCGPCGHILEDGHIAVAEKLSNFYNIRYV